MCVKGPSRSCSSSKASSGPPFAITSGSRAFPPVPHVEPEERFAETALEVPELKKSTSVSCTKKSVRKEYGEHIDFAFTTGDLSV